MKLARFEDVGWAVETEDGTFALQSPWLSLANNPKLGERVADDAVRLAPVKPSKILCIGLNYAKHAEEMNKRIPEEPLFFLKPPTALNHPGGTIVLPAQSSEIHHEGELAIVIGAELRHATPSEAAAGIFGYTCANDVTARDIQRRENQRYTRAKGFDSFCPVGPSVVLAKDFDPAENFLELRVNGDVRQASQLNDFIFQLPDALAFISSVMTLLPGDIVLTGTPSGVGELHDGDLVEVEISNIGTLTNHCAAG